MNSRLVEVKFSTVINLLYKESVHFDNFFIENNQVRNSVNIKHYFIYRLTI